MKVDGPGRNEMKALARGAEKTNGGDVAAVASAEVTALHPSWSSNPIASWLAAHEGRRTELGTLWEELCLKLVGQGVELYRVNLGIRSMHAEVAATSATWKRGSAGLMQIDHGYGLQLSESYRESPVRLIHEGAGAFRRRLEGPDVVRDFPIVDELIAEGCSDYVIMPLTFSTGVPNFISWSTDRPGGFTTAELTLLYDLLPLIAIRAEIEAAHQSTETFLATYLGREASKRVLSGLVRRGQVESIEAAIWVSDLRDFTELSDRMASRAVIALMDDYFDVVVTAVEAGGGEVLKFLGDGMLAIFNAGASIEEDCRNALAAAAAALKGLRSTNDERTGEGQAEIRSGIGLHRGTVQFGNIGAKNRLDFTVVGPAVNEAARVEALCKTMERPLLVSAAFAETVGTDKLDSLGFHALRGISEPREIFAPR